MLVRPNAPYADRFDHDGFTIIYEGHDVPHSIQYPEPKVIEQPEYTLTGNFTENGMFHKAAQEYKNKLRQPERVRVYEKIKQGMRIISNCFVENITWKSMTELNKRVNKHIMEVRK